jgi:hypothetical protein
MSTASGLCAAEVAEHRARDGGEHRAEGRRMRRQHRVPVAVQAMLRSAVPVRVIGCSSLRSGRSELNTNKNLDLWFQLICTKFKLKQDI